MGQFMQVREVVVEHKNVIKVDYKVQLVNEVIENGIHERLKGS